MQPQTAMTPSAATSTRPDRDARDAFAAALLPLTSICRPALTPDEMRAYEFALIDLPADVLFLAARKIASTRIYPTMPMPGEIRAAAAEIAVPAIPTFADAWRLALATSARLRASLPRRPITLAEYRALTGGAGENAEATAKERADRNARILDQLPAILAKAIRSFGDLYDNDICRGQFRRMYEELAAEEKARRQLPAAVARQIEAHQAAKAIPTNVQQIAGKIGLAS